MADKAEKGTTTVDNERISWKWNLLLFLSLIKIFFLNRNRMNGDNQYDNNLQYH